MQTPHGVKYNNRYRGPQESKKLNQFYVQARFNISNLNKKIENLELDKEYIKIKPKNITSLSIAVSEIINSIDITFDKILNYGGNNNE